MKEVWRIVHTISIFRCDDAPAKPGRVLPGTVKQLKGCNDMATFANTFRLPKPDDPSDVATRRLSVSVDGAAATTREYPGDTFNDKETDFWPSEMDGYTLGSTLTIQLVDVDAAGNASLSSTSTYVVVDTVPPAVPGQVSAGTVKQFP